MEHVLVIFCRTDLDKMVDMATDHDFMKRTVFVRFCAMTEVVCCVMYTGLTGTAVLLECMFSGANRE